MTPCNPCENGSCGSCVAEKLASRDTIRSAATHCGCAAKGHENTLESKLPKIKSMLGRQKEERDVPVERQVESEEPVEIERD